MGEPGTQGATASTSAPTGASSTRALEPFLVPLEGLAEVVRGILEPVLDAQGFELVQLHLVRGQNRDLLRLFLDKQPEAGVGISIGELETCNRLVGDLLDVEDHARGLFKKPYDLEVGSPGVDRPLTKKTHFSQAIGKKARVKTRNPVGAHGARSLTGVIEGASADTFTMSVEGEAEPVAVRFDDLTSAHLVFEFTSHAPKKAKGPKGHKGKKGRT